MAPLQLGAQEVRRGEGGEILSKYLPTPLVWAVPMGDPASRPSAGPSPPPSFCWQRHSISAQKPPSWSPASARALPKAILGVGLGGGSLLPLPPGGFTLNPPCPTHHSLPFTLHAALDSGSLSPRPQQHVCSTAGLSEPWGSRAHVNWAPEASRSQTSKPVS